jgi:hypothetical protein
LSRPLTPSERSWLNVRAFLRQRRYDLAVEAADEYPDGSRIAGTPLLGAADWSPSTPVPLHAIGLAFNPAPEDQHGIAGVDMGDRAARLLPERPDGTRYRRYSDVMKELDAPAVFENRSTYRLIAADLAAKEPRLEFGRGRYFDGIDVGEAAAHEYAAVRLGSAGARLRAMIGNPCDLRQRRANLAISTMTIRLDRGSGRASFLLHWRDPAKVGHAGGLYQVIPVGIFQPSGEAAWNESIDFSLWRCMIREFAEELRGQPEEYGSEYSPIAYDSWPFARHMTEAVNGGHLRVWCLGLGADPLTYATDLLTVAVIDSDVFDELFSLDPQRNAEGNVLAAREFDAIEIGHATTREPTQAAGVAVLRLAWQHRAKLLG